MGSWLNSCSDKITVSMWDKVFKIEKTLLEVKRSTIWIVIGICLVILLGLLLWSYKKETLLAPAIPPSSPDTCWNLRPYEGPPSREACENYCATVYVNCRDCCLSRFHVRGSKEVDDARNICLGGCLAIDSVCEKSCLTFPST